MISPIFVSGPHGSGKTTMINHLLKDQIFLENDFDIDFLKECPSISTMTHFEKCLTRLYHRMYVTSYSESVAADYPGRAILTSRGIYDSLGYINSYEKVGWLTKEQARKLNFIVTNPHILPHTIILNPGPDVVKERLNARIKNGSRSNRDKVFNYEDTDEFVEILCTSFEAMKDYPNVLYLEDNGEEDMQRVRNWVSNMAASNLSAYATAAHA